MNPRKIEKKLLSAVVKGLERQWHDVLMNRWYVKSAFVFLIVMSMLLIGNAQECQAVTAGTIEIKGLSSIGRTEFLDLFGIRKGDEIDEQKIRIGIKRAFLKGIFEDIAVDVSDGDDHSLTITVREKDYIRSVDIEGDFDLTRKQIRQMFLLREYQIMRYDLIDQATDRLRQSLSLDGFPDADVDVHVKPSGKPYRVDLIITLNTGSPQIIRRIKLPGGDDDAAAAMKLSAGDVFNESRILRDMDRIKESYVKKGFFSPEIGPYSYKESELVIPVNRGRQLEVKVAGNNVVSSKKLLKEIPFFEIETFNDAVVDEAVDRMISLYRKEGYAFAQIAPVIEADAEKNTVTFFIYEGNKIMVRTVTVEGSHFPKEQLKNVMTLKEGEIFNPELLENTRESLEEFYRALGYLDVEIEEVEAKKDKSENAVDLSVEINEGERTVIGSLEIVGADPDDQIRLRSIIGIKAGDPYNEVDIADARYKILDFYNNLGFTAIDVVITREIENHRAALVFSIVEGSKRLFGKTIITGNVKTKYEVIKRELLHKENDPFNFRTFSRNRQRLYKLGLFTSVDIEAVDQDEDTKDVLIRVEEGNAGSVDFGFGYAEYEKFRGFVELGYRNLWGMNRVGSARAELSSLEQRLIFHYQEPWFMGIDLPLRSFFLYENRKEITVDDRSTRFRLRRYSVTAGFEKELSEKLKAELYYEFSLVETFDVKPDVVLSKEDVGTLAISGIKPALIYDTRDNPFEPRKGVLAGISLKFASNLFFSESNFIKLRTFASYYQNLHKKVTLALSARGGIAYGFEGTDELPLVERFFIGGRSTVRGYEQDTLGPKGADGNPTGGNAFLIGNVEFRTLVTKSIGLVTFLDMGNVWVKARDMDPTDLRYTAGVGLRYNTPVGPLRIDYGVKLNKETEESRGEIHFSIGHAF